MSTKKFSKGTTGEMPKKGEGLEAWYKEIIKGRDEKWEKTYVGGCQPSNSDAADATAFAFKKRNPNKTKHKKKSKFETDPFYHKQRKQMANKFLPFVVESSTPHNIFKTLISRSKGMNRALIASVFNLTLNVPIKELRKLANDLDEMPLDNLYEELLQKYDIYRINTDALAYFTDVIDYFPKERDEAGYWWSDKLTDFSAKDVMMFFCVYTLKNKIPGEYSKINFHYLHNYENHLKNFKKHVKFADDGVVMEFAGLRDLKTFIVYTAVLRPQMEPESKNKSICARYKK